MKKNNAGLRSSLKVFLVIALMLLLLIPLSMIQKLVNERDWRAQEVAQEIVNGAGGSLSFTGPLFIMPYEINEKIRQDGEWVWVKRTEEVYVLPETLSVTGRLDTSYRSRGIYQVPVYETDLNVSGHFPEISKEFFPKGAEPKPEQFRLVAGIADMRGIREVSSLNWAGKEFTFSPEAPTQVPGSSEGAERNPVLTGGISVKTGSMPAGGTDFSWSMIIGGGRNVSITPLGRNSELFLEGNWPSPSFGGAVLPDERTVNEEGFSARWRIPEVSRPIQPYWNSADGALVSLYGYELEVQLMEAVSTYSRTERSVKYGALFLLIPFVVFLLFEVLGKTAIHPVQYLLAGAADVVFYLLLLAISEHLKFSMAYLLGAGAVTILLWMYSLQIAGNFRRSLAMPLVMGSAYLWLWVTLQSEDYALLIGSIGIFVLVALVMLITRKVDWFAASRPEENAADIPAGRAAESGSTEL